MTTAIDAINGKNGTYIATATGVAGLVPGDNAADFIGLGNGVDGLPNDTFLPGNGDLSVVCLFRRLTDNTLEFLDFEFSSASPLTGLAFGLTDGPTNPDPGPGSLYVTTTQVGLGATTFFGDTPVAPGPDVHLGAVTRSGMTWTFYLDGNSDGGATLDADLSTGSAGGRHFFLAVAGENHFVLDEFATFTHALSGADIADLWAARTSYAAYNAAVLALSPFNYWHFDELSGVVTPSGWHIGQIGMAS